MAQKALGTSFQGTFGPDSKVIKQIEKQKKETALVNSIIMKPKSIGKGKCKHGTKGASKGTARGSKGKATKDKILKGKTKGGAKKPAATTEKKKEVILAPSRGHVRYLT